MRTLAVTCLLVGLGASVAAGQDAGIEAVTRPSADVLLKFVQPGRVAEVRVKEGDRVAEGDVLVRLDDSVERLQAEQLKAEAENLLHIQAAEAQVAQRKADLAKLEWAGQRGAATQWEIEHQRLDVKIGELSVAKARFDRAQAQRQYRQALASLERMVLKSPIDGLVEGVAFEPGEAVKALEEVVRVVAIDPLWIDVPVPLPVARRLKKGGPAEVVFPAPDPETRTGRIIHISAVADAAAETLTVRVEVANPGGRPAGERVRVRFPAGGETAGAASSPSRAPAPSPAP